MAPGRPETTPPDEIGPPDVTGPPDERPGVGPRTAPESPWEAPRAASGAVVGARAGLEADEPLALPLEGLLPDAHGNVVLMAEPDLGAVRIVTGERVVGSGAAAPRSTATGIDVSGYRFVRFASGVTLFYPDGIDLLVTSAPAPWSAPAP